MNSAIVLDQREKGQFPLSVATSLALEGLLGTIVINDKPFEGPAPVLNCDELWINVRTLFRNLMGSIKNESSTQMNADSYALGMLEELTIIRSVMEEHTRSRVKVFFYLCTHQSIEKTFPFANFKEAKTDRQRFYAALEEESLDILLKRALKDDVILFDVNIRCHQKRIFMLTSFPTDLILTKDYVQLVLLESHTGAVKDRPRWHTKLNGGKDLLRIPFDRMTAQVFGDSGGLFSPYPRNYRETLLKIAEKYQWTSVTSKERILQTVKLSHEPILLATISKLY